MLKSIQLCVYQFCVIKPGVGLILAVLEVLGIHQPGVFTITSLMLMAVKGISLAVAMLALITFYRLCHQVLQSYNILSKFMVIKVVIFLNVVYVCGPRSPLSAGPRSGHGPDLAGGVWAGAEHHGRPAKRLCLATWARTTWSPSATF